ncbi:sigma-54 dependent transcriptional regulator [Desulfosarcina ovata subsp. sediminis]|uniref:Sigma-54 dependent transcriptional regulator n=1 Tax=Desulfosarcina ovata subsp. sediminis TaxID=885957 RepID=A0A5K7ZUG7_9BACT|nr:sigma 54-interacting transcriptional regulator [Desulfosarcina ovata]BBO83801.1 sigma-54 dependent transcriptional regulator [Desulfosarcina ovata subsp. sediminis]
MTSDPSVMYALSDRVTAFDTDGRLLFGSQNCISRLNLEDDLNLAAAHTHQWPLFESVMYNRRGRIGIRLGVGDDCIVVDAYPLSKEAAKGVICWLRSPDDRDDLKELNEQLKSIIDASYDGLWLCDHRANILTISKSFERKHGMKAETLIGRNMRDLVAEGLLDRSVTLEVLEKRRMVTRVQTSWDGRRILTTGNPVLDENGEIVMVVCNDRDLGHLGRYHEEIMAKNEISVRFQDQLINQQVAEITQQDIIYRSSAMQRLIDKAIMAANADSNVLIAGPSGSGKEKIADLIHNSSARCERAMIRVNCGAIPENLFESEFFGHDPGAFTGARKEGKAGLVELAHQSTLFLDEVAEIPLLVQVKLLRFLDDGTFFRVGSTKGRRLDVRIVAATNRNLEKMVSEGLFREDLFYRLRVIPLRIPGLKDRREDIPVLINHFIERFSEKFDRQVTLSMEAMDLLQAYTFPGNVRELIHLCEQIVVMGSSEVIRASDLPAYVRESQNNLTAQKTIGHAPNPSIPLCNWDLKQRLYTFEKELIREALDHFPNQKTLAAALGIDPATVTRKLQKFHLSRSRQNQ